MYISKFAQKKLTRFSLIMAFFAGPVLLSSNGIDEAIGLNFDASQVYAAKKQTRKLPGLSEKVFKGLGKVADYASPPEDSGKQPNFNAALSELRKIEKRCKDSCNRYELSQIYNYFAWISYSKEDTKGAINYYKKVIAQSPELPIALELSALKYVAQLSYTIDRMDEAVSYLDRYMALTTDLSADIYQLRASFCYHKGDKACALRDINKAVSMVEAKNKIADETWYSLQRALYLDKEDYKSALPILEKMVRHYPKNSTWIQLAGVYGLLNRDKDQMHAMDAVYVAGGLEKSQDLVNLAYMYIGESVPARGARILENGMKKKIIERNEKYLNVLAVAHRQAKEPDKAAPVLEEMGKRFNSGDAYSKLTGVYLDMDKSKESIEAGKKALSKGNLKDAGEVHANMGIAYMDLKQYNNAVTAFGKAVKFKKHERFARSWLQYAENEKSRTEQLAKALAADL